MFDTTPLAAPKKNVLLKLDHLHKGGSHKARAAKYVVKAALETGELEPGGPRRIIEKSGGNFGVGLAYEGARNNIGVDLVIGLSFSKLKKRMCQEYGANLVGIDKLEEGLQPNKVIESLMEQYGDGYFFTDQFNNQANFDAHYRETAPELARQIDRQQSEYEGISLVLAAGTGAHAAAFASVFRERYTDVRLIIVEPENCSFEHDIFEDHCQFGAAVGVRPPFLDGVIVDRYQKVSDKNSKFGQRLLAREMGYYTGPTSGSNYMAALIEAEREPNRMVISMTYDAGDAYLQNDN